MEDSDHDLPQQISGPPNASITKMTEQGFKVSQLITDHFHLWEAGAGNYHMAFTGHEFIRGIESDAYRTDYLKPGSFFCPPSDLHKKNERHYRNIHLTRENETDYTCAKVFRAASTWLKRNHQHEDFYLHLDCFPPHEPLDPPEELLKLFWPTGYEGIDPDWRSGWSYASIEEQGFTPERVRFCQALYAANVVLVDRWLGHLLDTLDELDLWSDTLLIFTTDHGTYNGDHHRLGKLQTHEHDAVGHIPLILCHPTLGQGERRSQLTQLVDLYPTTLAALGVDCPPERHGVNLLPALADAESHTRDYAIAGQFGASTSITDGHWILHQSPPDPSREGNQPLYWHGLQGKTFLDIELGPYRDGKRTAGVESWPTETWLSNKEIDPNELDNIATSHPDEVTRLQEALVGLLGSMGAPAEQTERLGISSLL